MDVANSLLRKNGALFNAPFLIFFTFSIAFLYEFYFEALRILVFISA